MKRSNALRDNNFRTTPAVASATIDERGTKTVPVERASTRPALNALYGNGTRRSTRLATTLLAAVAVGVSSLAGTTAEAVTTEGPQLVANGGFEAGTTGWAPNIMAGDKGAVLSRVQGGHNSGYAARITARSDGLATLNDTPNTLGSTEAFGTYKGSAWVRTPTPGVGVQLRIQEVVNGNVVGTGGAQITLNDTQWHPLSTVYTASRTGSELNFNVISFAMQSGRSFDVDSVSLREQVISPPTTVWAPVYRNDFTTMTDVNPSASSSADNSALLPSDTENGPLQKPTIRSNVAISADGATSDGKALGVHTRKGSYPTSSGTKTGWTNGRMMIGGHNEAPPVRIKARMRFTASVKTKSAVMWWPAGGGWPWEVDFAETFGGSSLTDYWGGRQHIGQRWHSDINGDGAAVEQLIHDDDVDATKYHVYDLIIEKDVMSISIDGVKTFETRDPAYIPDTAGAFAIGKALTGRRDSLDRTEDSVYVDWLEIHRPVEP